MLDEFTYLMNLGIECGEVPQAWKIAMVIPIPKVTAPKNVLDLRPISLLTLPRKILEKPVHQNLLDFIEKHHILSDEQFGFRPGLSTSGAISELIGDIGFNINANKLTIATFVDLAKAFDTLDHTLFLEKLSVLNPYPTTLQWFASCLTNRSQCTQIGNFISSEMPI